MTLKVLLFWPHINQCQKIVKFQAHLFFTQPRAATLARVARSSRIFPEWGQCKKCKKKGNCLFCVRVWLLAESLNVNFVCVCVFVCFVIAVLLCIKKCVCLLGQEYAMKLTLCVPLLLDICTMVKNSSKSSLWCFKRPKITNLSLSPQICSFKCYQRKMCYDSHVLHWWWTNLKHIRCRWQGEDGKR